MLKNVPEELTAHIFRPASSTEGLCAPTFGRKLFRNFRNTNIDFPILTVSW